MASILEFLRYRSELDRQLLRRIGYTNGLHYIERFARVVEYVYPNIPCSLPLLQEIIINSERERTGTSALKGDKYTQGIIDVTRALGLLEKVGPKISLTGKGYALHAIKNIESYTNRIKPFMFVRVLEADGEYTLNILRLIDEGYRGSKAIGEELMKRFLTLMEFKAEQARQLPDKLSQDVILSALAEAKKILEKALRKEGVDRFYKHTVNPRQEWLRDLGYIVATNDHEEVTTSGKRVLSYLARRGCYQEHFISLPFSEWLASTLGIPNRVTAKDLFWSITVYGISGAEQKSEITQDTRGLLEKIKSIYPYVKLVDFNEAEVSSLYEVLACLEAVNGKILPEDDFGVAMQDILRKYPREVFNLTKRRGIGSYIALKQA